MRREEPQAVSQELFCGQGAGGGRGRGQAFVRYMVVTDPGLKRSSGDQKDAQ